jgi:aminoglycoside phosphotransferase (APT) family kinase protein
MGSDERAETISERLQEILGEPLTASPRRLSSGASRETWTLATAGHGELVAQLDASGASYGDRPPQAPVLEAAAAAGVPVARVIAAGGEDAALGRSWTVMQALAGTTDPARIVDADGVPSGPALIDSVAAALAAVHRMPADTALAPTVDDPLGLVRQMHEAVGQPHPVFELTFGELARTRAGATKGASGSRRQFVHGDFRIGNLMVGPHGVTGVLDWELAHIGDPVADLGWLCVPAWRFTRPDRPAGGLATREQLLDAYERHTGVRIGADELRWWELLGTLRWGVMCGLQAQSHLSGARPSLEHAVIGRRACEVEWDLLQMLDAQAADPAPEPAESRGGAGDPGFLHDRPTGRELLDAARSALGDDVLPLLDGRASFQLRVALRALGVVERQLEHSEADAELHADVLAEFGVADDEQLAQAIRTGRLRGREPELSARLREIVTAKLRVANPRYIRQQGRAQ